MTTAPALPPAGFDLFSEPAPARERLAYPAGTRHILCLSGGDGSAKCAVEMSRRFEAENCDFINHDINKRVEDEDIKRFKREVADYCGVPLTYVNMPGVEDMDQFDVSLKAKAFKIGPKGVICTSRLKTEPFHLWLAENFPGGKGCVIYYGFGIEERARIQRRSSILGEMGYKTDYPLALWTERTIRDLSEIGIRKPNTYSQFKHANCVGCIKAGRQHWYVVYCTRPDIFAKAKYTEDVLGHSIINGVYLEDLEEDFVRMRAAGIPATEHINPSAFWSISKRAIALKIAPNEDDENCKPCECLL